MTDKELYLSLEKNDYLRKIVLTALKIDSQFITFNKISICTRQCYGYDIHYNGYEDVERAGRDAERFRTSPEPFLRMNLKPQLKKVEDLEKALQKNLNVYISNKYYYEDLVCYYQVALEDRDEIIASEKHYKKLSKEQVEKVLECEKYVLVDLYKRLNTYLKKYGTSKLTSWTYDTWD